jgi:hypothetical protein
VARSDGGPPDSVHWPTYGEMRADLDRIIDALETKMREIAEALRALGRETEERIMRRLDAQDHSFERAVDQQRDEGRKLEDRLRLLEQENATLKSQGLQDAIVQLRQDVTVLRTTNRIIAAGGSLVAAVLSLALAALALRHA